MGEPIASRIWGLPKMVPSNGWFIMENTIAGWFMDGLWMVYFMENPKIKWMIWR